MCCQGSMTAGAFISFHATCVSVSSFEHHSLPMQFFLDWHSYLIVLLSVRGDVGGVLGFYSFINLQLET